MRFLTFALINLISLILFVQVESKFILNISKKLNKKSKECKQILMILKDLTLKN